MELACRIRRLANNDGRLARVVRHRRYSIIDVDWDDNPFTDIDVLWMSLVNSSWIF